MKNSNSYPQNIRSFRFFNRFYVYNNIFFLSFICFFSSSMFAAAIPDLKDPLAGIPVGGVPITGNPSGNPLSPDKNPATVPSKLEKQESAEEKEKREMEEMVARVKKDRGWQLYNPLSVGAEADVRMTVGEFRGLLRDVRAIIPGSSSQQEGELSGEAQKLYNTLKPQVVGFLRALNEARDLNAVGDANDLPDSEIGIKRAQQVRQAIRGIDGILKLLAESGNSKQSQMTQDIIALKKELEQTLASLLGRPTEIAENAGHPLYNLGQALENVKDGTGVGKKFVNTYGAAGLQLLLNTSVIDEQGQLIKDPTLDQRLRALLTQAADNGEERASRLFRNHMGKDSWVGQVGKLIAFGVSVTVIVACKKAYDAFGGIKKIRKDFISFIRELILEVTKGGTVDTVNPVADVVENKEVNAKNTELDTENIQKNSKKDNQKDEQKDSQQKDNQKDSKKDTVSQTQEQVAKKQIAKRWWM